MTRIHFLTQLMANVTIHDDGAVTVDVDFNDMTEFIYEGSYLQDVKSVEDKINVALTNGKRHEVICVYKPFKIGEVVENRRNGLQYLIEAELNGDGLVKARAKIGTDHHGRPIYARRLSPLKPRALQRIEQ